MKLVLPTLLLILAAWIVTTGFDAGLPEPSETDIIRVENEMMQAFQEHDRLALDRIIGSEFLLTSPTSNGHQIDKQQYIDGGLDLPRIDSFRFHDFRIRLFESTAIVDCRLDWKSAWGGTLWDTNFVMTDVWHRTGGDWQIVSRHSSYSAEED